MPRSLHPQLRLIWVTSMVGDYLLQQAMDAGLPGFVHKDDPLEVLVTAIENVAAGTSYVSETIKTRLAEFKQAMNQFNRLLSPREQEVLRYIGCGFDNQEAATHLGLSAGTIHSHRRNIMAKLQIHTAADLIAYAIRHGFVDPNALRAVGAPPPAAP